VRLHIHHKTFTLLTVCLAIYLFYDVFKRFCHNYCRQSDY